MDTCRLNPGLERALARSRDAIPMLRDAAEGVAAQCQQLAREEAYLTGSYHDGLGFDAGVREDGTVAGRVVGRDFKTSWIEVGWTDEAGRHHEGKAILRRGAEQYGLDVTKGASR